MAPWIIVAAVFFPSFFLPLKLNCRRSMAPSGSYIAGGGHLLHLTEPIANFPPVQCCWRPMAAHIFLIWRRPPSVYLTSAFLLGATTLVVGVLFLFLQELHFTSSLWSSFIYILPAHPLYLKALFLLPASFLLAQVPLFICVSLSLSLYLSLPFFIFIRLRSRRVVMCLVVVYVHSFVRSFPHINAGI